MTVEEGRLYKDKSKPLVVQFKLSNNIKNKCGLWVYYLSNPFPSQDILAIKAFASWNSENYCI